MFAPPRWWLPSLTLALCLLTACASPTPYVIYLTVPAPSATVTPSPSVTPTPNALATAWARRTATAYVGDTFNTQVAATVQTQAAILVLTSLAIPTPTVNPIVYHAWTQFQSPEWGVMFVYPAYFATAPYSDKCAPQISDNALEVGEWIWVNRHTFDPTQSSLVKYVDEQKKQFEAQAAANKDDGNTILETTWGEVDHIQRVTVKYHFGTLGENVIQTYFVRQNWLYVVAFLEGAGETCESIAVHDERALGKALGELEAYWHLLATWQFVD